MKPTVISANANSAANNGGNADPNAMHIPINHEHHHAPHYANAEATANAGSYGSPRQHPPQHQIPAHFQQDFGFEPDMDIDMDMFPRGRLGRMHHDPFANFGGSHFGFPEWTGSMGRRRIPEDNDFFNRLPSEFRQYMPSTMGRARDAANRGGYQQQPQQQQPTMTPQQQQPQYHQYQNAAGTPPNSYGHMPPQSPQSKKLCDAAIQTEDTPTTAGGPGPVGASYDQVDHTENLNQHGLRNTVDMGVKTPPEGEQHGPRAHSAPPPEQQQQQNNIAGQHQQQPQQRHMTPPQQTQFGTQTSPQTPNASNAYQKAYYPPPHQQAHPMQKQRTPPPPSSTAGGGPQPQTPGGTYIRTIPIFVEGRSEPIINSHKEIPNQNAPPQYPQQQQQQPQYQQQQAKPNAAGGNYAPHPQQQQHPQQQHRPTPLNTHQQPTAAEQQTAGSPPPPQTPHTLDSINKIQDIQRDVLDLMGKVEKFLGTRKDKEYAYLDEMLTRNLLKLDTIDTQGKDSIRLARKEAIKCIQASINVLEAKAEENAKTAEASAEANEATATGENPSEQTNEITTDEPIPLPPPTVEKSSSSSANSASNNNEAKEASPPKDAAEAATLTEQTTTNEAK